MDPTKESIDLDNIMIDINSDDFLLFGNDYDYSLSSLPEFPCPDPLSPASSSSSSWTHIAADATDAQPKFLEELFNDDVEMWDPNSLFPEESNTVEKIGGEHADETEATEEELGKVFLEWLKDNKDAISPEDLRNIKLKKSTIECASARLGGGSEGRVKLVKLILAWVQNNHLRKRRQQQPELPVPAALAANPNPDFSYNFDEFGFCNYNPWMQMGCPYPYPYPMQMRPPPLPQQYAGGFVYQAAAVAEGGMASATKEARRKRMARQRRYSNLHPSRSGSQQQHHRHSYVHQPHNAAWAPHGANMAWNDAVMGSALTTQQKQNAAPSAERRQVSLENVYFRVSN